MFLQKTLRRKVQIQGHGLHSGKPATLSFVPAPAQTGIIFVRTDLAGSPQLQVLSRNVSATSYATTLSGPAFSVATIEHCVSALAALRIDNLFIELDGPEIPIMDGSAKPFYEALTRAGLIELEEAREYISIRQPIEWSDGDKWAKVSPYQGLRVTATIDFPHPLIGKQTFDLDVNEVSFGREIAYARTFGFLKDVQALKSRGLIQGGSLENAVVLNESGGIENPEGLRASDEFVRHKVLDALGDLVTLGAPLLGHVELYKAGHDVMQKLIAQILSHQNHFEASQLGGALSKYF